MDLTGANFIGKKRGAAGDKSFKGVNPSSGLELEGDFMYANEKELTEALTLADFAFTKYRKTTTKQRAEFLDAIAFEIMELGDSLLQRCVLESGLAIGRITGERGRTVGQLKMFAQLIRDGWYVDARIDTALPNRQPLPRSDIRRMLIPIGPVAVFGASNFPLAFSTAGGDTASALAAGCPVIVKAHPSHPGTHEMICNAIIKAVEKTGMPDGVFSALYLSNEDAIKLVEHSVVKAVGFTGSRNAGMHLFNAAVSRSTPIPVYAEMSAINPVILLEGALRENKEKIAKDLAGSVTLGAGQFCTNPGLVLAVGGKTTDEFLSEYSNQIRGTQAQVMLNGKIREAYNQKISEFKTDKLVHELAHASKEASSFEGLPVSFTISSADFSSNKKFMEEIFGPYNLIVRCQDADELLEVINNLDGQLTATLHATNDDIEVSRKVIEAVTEKAGRIIYGGYPTGVEVSHSMQHGGPFPATTDARSTSVGTAAIYRFLRPVAFQDLPDDLLPDALKRGNSLSVLRLVDGNWSKDPA